MKHVTIRLADAEGVVLEERTVEGDFASIDAYVAALVLAETEMRARERARLEYLLLEGVRSPSRPWTPEVMEEIRNVAQPRS